MNSVQRKQFIKAAILILSALTAASLRNIPIFSIMPLAVSLIECLIFLCIMTAAQISDWKTSAVIGVLTPICLWIQRFTDGFMVPVCILSNLTMTVCLLCLARFNFSHIHRLLLTALSAFCILLLGSTAAIWLVKDESIIRAFIVAWNTCLYSGLSLLAAALIDACIYSLKARPRP